MGGERPRRVVVATGNPGKLVEIRAALDLPGLEFVAPADTGRPAPDVVEDGETFDDNALKKALAFHDALGMAALADDSGLVVDALGGAPGVRSARYAGEDATDAANNQKLLAGLADVPEGQRSARFVCSVAYVDEEGAATLAAGVCEGSIGFEPRGSGGFGYDPLFLPVEAPGRSMAELDIAEKTAISHRGRALAALREVLLRREDPAG